MLPRSFHRRISLVFILTLAILAPILMAPGCRPPILVHDGESIQAAVDAAHPGDTILVLPGTYTGTAGDDSVVHVQTSRITIRGSWGAVIDATGFEYGIMVGEDAPLTPDGCPPSPSGTSRFQASPSRTRTIRACAWWASTASS